jgi:ribonuclease HI
MAVVQALKRLKRPCQVELTTDSQYTVNGIRRFIRGNRPLKTNPDVWKQFWQVAKPHKISVKHIRGHQDDILNIIADNYAAHCGNYREPLELRMTMDELLKTAPQKKVRY